MGKRSVFADVRDAFGSELDTGQQDVYLAKEGRISVDVGIGGSSLVGNYFAGLPVLREVARRRAAPRAGVKPAG